MECGAGLKGRSAIAQGVGVLQQQTAIFAAVLALGLTGAGSADAQAIYYGPRVYDPGPRVYDPALPPYEIMRIVRSAGLAPLTRPTRRGSYYVVIAGTRSGGHMRVLVDAYAGDILRINPMLGASPYGPRLAVPYDPQLRPPAPLAPPYDPAPRMTSPNEPTPPLVSPSDSLPRLVVVPPEIREPPVGMLPPMAQFDGGVRPIPPRPIPNGRIVTAPSTMAPTPMPRPRPNVATNEASAPALAAPALPPAATPAPVTPSTPAARPEALQMIPVAPLE